MRRQINPNELASLYQAIGEGIWQLQHVETALNKYIVIKVVIKRPGAVDQREAEQALAKHMKKTFGASLEISRKKNVLSSSLQKRMERFKEERNWLVHKSVPDNQEDLYLDSTRTQFFQRIQLFCNEARTLHSLILDELLVFGQAGGVDTDKVVRGARQYLARLKGEIQ